MTRLFHLLFALCLGLLVALPALARQPVGEISLHSLPPEARDTLALIQRGGPFSHRRDGIVFRNFEGILPERHRGYYREYTVPTPGARNRGARRIVAGIGPGRDVRSSGEYWYTSDHYQSFSRIKP